MHKNSLSFSKGQSGLSHNSTVCFTVAAGVSVSSFQSHTELIRARGWCQLCVRAVIPLFTARPFVSNNRHRLTERLFCSFRKGLFQLKNDKTGYQRKRKTRVFAGFQQLRSKGAELQAGGLHVIQLSTKLWCLEQLCSRLCSSLQSTHTQAWHVGKALDEACPSSKRGKKGGR